MMGTRPARVGFEGAQHERAFRACDHPDCPGEGLHRAPHSREMLDSYYWFCLEHARSYNAAWDFFAGMSQSEIDEFRRADVTWHRPTWPMGPRTRLGRLLNGEGIRDLFGIFGDDGEDGAKRDRCAAAALPAGERDALATMDLGLAATPTDIRSRFKELVKRNHPDVNGGDKAAEERLKVVISAYRMLMRQRTA